MFARFPRRPSLMLVGAVALVVVVANPAAAPPGDLDPTFSGDGKVTTDFAGDFDDVGGVAIQGDGKIVVAGGATVSGVFDFDFALARYNVDGSLDTTFDGDGKVTTDFAGDFHQARAVAIQGDGKIVAVGNASALGFPADFALARYNADGSLDTTFDGDGKVTTDFAGDFDVAEGVAIQGDGKIVAAGLAFVSGNNDFALARYNPDGSLDTTFDGDGKVTTNFFAGYSEAHSVAMQGDGKIVAVGNASALGFDFALARYNADGSLDATFDSDGRVTTDIASDSFDGAEGVAIQGNGKIVAAGLASLPEAADFALARYNADGSLDPTFDGDGKVTTDFAGGADVAYSVAIQTMGRIVAAGYAQLGTDDFALARYRTNGSLDPTFSGDGKVTTDFAGDFDEARAVAIQANGRIVAAGVAFVTGNGDFALARYTCFRRTSRPIFNPLCS
jgi:uncharacterized delta-60 repeat protein